MKKLYTAFCMFIYMSSSYSMETTARVMPVDFPVEINDKIICNVMYDIPQHAETLQQVRKSFVDFRLINKEWYAFTNSSDVTKIMVEKIATLFGCQEQAAKCLNTSQSEEYRELHDHLFDAFHTPETMKELLDKGVNPNYRCMTPVGSFQTPLGCFLNQVDDNGFEIIKLLLAYGASVNVVAYKGFPLDFAIYKNFPRAVALILSYKPTKLFISQGLESSNQEIVDIYTTFIAEHPNCIATAATSENDIELLKIALDQQAAGDKCILPVVAKIVPFTQMLPSTDSEDAIEMLELLCQGTVVNQSAIDRALHHATQVKALVERVITLMQNATLAATPKDDTCLTQQDADAVIAFYAKMPDLVPAESGVFFDGTSALVPTDSWPLSLEDVGVWIDLQ